MEPKEPLGPPELPKGNQPAAQSVSHVTPQLVSSQTSITPVATEQDEPDELNEHVQDPGDPDGLVAAEERRRWEAEHPKPVPQQPKTRKKKHKWPVVLLVLILIGAAGYGAYWFGNKQATKNQTAGSGKTAQTAGQQGGAKSTVKTPAATVPTKHYDSATYTLGFDYPQTWAISDTTAKLLAVSPTTSLTSSTGSTVNGHVVVAVMNQQTTIAGYPAGGALEAIESKKISYTQPTSVQRAQTYISYLGYRAATSLDAIYVTGDNGYKQGQNVPVADVIKGNPLISVSFESCTSEDCATGTPTMLSVSASKWASSALATQVENLLKSLQLD